MSSTPPGAPDDRFATATRSETTFHPYKRIGVGQGPPSYRNLHRFGMCDLDITCVDNPNFLAPAENGTFLPHVQGHLPNNASCALQEFKMWVNACLAGEVHPNEFVVSTPSDKQFSDIEQQFRFFMTQVKSASCGLLKKEALMRTSAVMLQLIWTALRVNYSSDYSWTGLCFDVAREPVVRSDKMGGLHYFDPQGDCVSVPCRGEQWFTNIGFPHLAASPHFQTCLKNPHSSGVFRGGSAPPPGQASAPSNISAVSPIAPIGGLNESGGHPAAEPKVQYSEDELNDDGDPIDPAVAPKDNLPVLPIGSPSAVPIGLFSTRIGAASSSSGVAAAYVQGFAGSASNQDVHNYMRNDSQPGISSWDAGTKFAKMDNGDGVA
eukprot:g10350.t1